MPYTIYNVELQTYDMSLKVDNYKDLGKLQLKAYENPDLEKILIFKSKFLVNQIFFKFKILVFILKDNRNEEYKYTFCKKLTSNNNSVNLIVNENKGLSLFIKFENERGDIFYLFILITNMILNFINY